MTSSRSPQRDELTDAELTAWLDGEADDLLHARVAAARGAELETRLAALERGKSVAVKAFAEVMAQAPAQPDTLSAGQSPRRSFAATFVAGLTGVAAGLVLALALGNWLAPRPAQAPGAVTTSGVAEPWQREVAAYHALYVPQTLAAQVPASPEAAAVRLAQLSQALGRDVTGMPEPEGLIFVRGQELGFDGQVLVQLAFASADGSPYALCILRKEGPEAALTRREIQGMAAASWSDAGHRFLLIGGQDAERVGQWAQVFLSAL